MHRLGEVDTTEVAFGEHHPLGVQAGEVLVPEVMAGELTVYPVLHS